MDAKVRAEARSCSAEMHAGFLVLREAMPMNCRAMDRRVSISDALGKDINRIDTMWAGLREKYCGKGPWLFGDFSIADCMYAPVVMRFITYNIAVSETSSIYINNLRAHPKIQLWIEQAMAETETINCEEVGI